MVGDHFIQFGDSWRIGQSADTKHLSITHKDGKTAQIFRHDGTLHPGPRTDYNSWNQSSDRAKGISFGHNYVQIGNWRLGATNASHLSVTHKGGKLAVRRRKFSAP